MILSKLDGRTKPILQLKKVISTIECEYSLSDEPLAIGDLLSARKTILYISDFYSITYLYNFKISKKVVFLIKSIFYFFFELIFYRFYKAILVQSDFELKYAKMLKLKNCYKLTNYSNFQSSSSGYSAPKAPLRYGMIAKFENIYIHQINEIRDTLVTDTNIVLAGQNSDIWKNCKNINIMGYVDFLSDFYHRVDVSLCISFKNFGFINKVIEAVLHKKIIIVSSGSLNEMAFLSKYSFVFVIQQYSDLQYIDKKITRMLPYINEMDFELAIKELKNQHGLHRYIAQIRRITNDIG